LEILSLPLGLTGTWRGLLARTISAESLISILEDGKILISSSKPFLNQGFYLICSIESLFLGLGFRIPAMSDLTSSGKAFFFFVSSDEDYIV
jgi:hypothetical protein